MLSSSMPLLNLILLIDVTFSTPTRDYTSLRRLLAEIRVKECADNLSFVTRPSYVGNEQRPTPHD
jgi:hypothetical protein